MAERASFEFDHRGYRIRLERGPNDWAVLIGTKLIDRIPANVEEGPNSDLESLAKRVVNSHLQERSPRGI
jgi:hypothetical protein